MTRGGPSGRYDAVIVGGGHNGLVAAALLARAGRSVLVLERGSRVGGAAVSERPFAGVDARVSRYAYLVSLFPRSLLRTLGVDVELRPRAVASYTPDGAGGVLIGGGEPVAGSPAGPRNGRRLGSAGPARLRGNAGGNPAPAGRTRLRGNAGGSPAPAGRTRLRGNAGGSPAPAGRTRLRGSAGEDPAAELARFQAVVGPVARRLFPTLTEPLRSRAEIRRLIDDEAAWRALFEEPLSEVLERSFSSDLLRGLVLTDATIGTFAPAGDPELRQNRCFLYHVIGNGTGRWDVPVGGMGALTRALALAARRAGADIETRSEVVSIVPAGSSSAVAATGAGRAACAEVACADGRRYHCRHVLAAVAPATLARLLGESPPAPAPEGSQLKINMVLKRLPALRDPDVTPSKAFAGTFHVNEGYEQLQRAYEEAAAGQIPSVPPCELYCHTLTDPGILSDELRAAAAHTLTLFGLHMPARLFAAGDERAKDRAVQATLRSVDSVLAEPLQECLWLDANGAPCLEARTPSELEAELGLPGGHIFHRDLAWPFAETDAEVGTWGVETSHPNVWVCGAGARRGGGVSGIPGHNAARAVLDADRRDQRVA